MILADAITATPCAIDPDLGHAAAARFAHHGADFAALVAGAAGTAPYLAGLIAREGGWLDTIAGQDPARAMADVLAAVGAVPPDTPTATLATTLREAKRRVALLTALADLGGVWDLEVVTRALSDLADAAVHASLTHLVGAQQARGKLPATVSGQAPPPCGGIFALAMGKLGARELNYSSDIDLIMLFDESLYPRDAYADVRRVFIRVTQDLVKLMAEVTAQGYVFRTDLRLRPDPSATPVCIGMAAAARYYESQGRTWERAAMIRARVSAGDIDAGERFLDELSPFIWRRHLDFAAIEDAHDIRRKIRSHRGFGTRFRLPGHNVKLGRGGIREIEFFIQTKQLIVGGRDASLRVPRTLPALTALARAGWVSEAAARALGPAYVAHRGLEHRLQMLDDAQTHIYPATDAGRVRLAALCGQATREGRARMETGIAARFDLVHHFTDDFFDPAEPADSADARGSEAALWSAFPDPEATAALVAAWQHLPSLRTARARDLFAALTPALALRLAGAAEPDHALMQFDRFLRGLPAGVQVFSLFKANPQVLDLLVDICATAPRLAEYLGRNAGVLDALLAADFYEPLPGAAALTQDLAAQLDVAGDYEQVLDRARIWAREGQFRVGVQLLRGLSQPPEAAAAYSALAEATVNALLPHVTAEVARRHGPPPGQGAAIVAMGKLGSAEMTARSDLDLIVVFDAPTDAQSDGPRPLAAKAYFARWTQVLVAALSAPTAQGTLYAVDMRLRPSGRSGPVATSLAAFAAYQAEEAWTWEHLALTRARVLTGAPALQDAVRAAIVSALSAPRDAAQVFKDGAEMRTRMAQARPRSASDPWELKDGRGRMLDIELALQSCALALTPGPRGAPRAMIDPLVAAGSLTAAEGEDLARALDVLRALQQICRLCLDGNFDPEKGGPGLTALLCEVADVADPGPDPATSLAHHLTVLTARAGDIVDRVMAVPGAAPDPSAGTKTP